ncbi:MAG: 2-oxoacid:acceptor oxidoreductase family protein [Planctomycetota bacterium]|jgi:2-oxoacid:acceptor oxidoreductase gamma subunit (pyruvate/2-ketoisovalerate family)/2-oxoacid:acceptor oxidoreductase delta subunit (pyruvate/2-ketoisovalerate family)|nr:2-oxoacid:acceptor oxidoreductase family protein [Planctomycetota bacterium]MDP6940921.1 2-oxoacid:acceptor oxidoreductase family protein [Planctomycetota bacterium]
MEIRLHGRGGQGGVTCAKILAAVYTHMGKSVQTFGDYAGERSGAPVRAYTRVEDGDITNRNKVYAPDHLLILDPSLMGAQVVSGLQPGGTLLVNTTDPQPLQESFEDFRVVCVDATAIARKHKIGTRTVVIVNTTIAGAFVRALDIPLEVLEQTYTDLGFLSNFDAAKEAYETASIRETDTQAPAEAVEDTAVAGYGGSAGGSGSVVPLTEHRESGPTGLKTGSWRTQSPIYRERLAPCSAWCPAGNDAIGFVQAVGEKGDEQSVADLGASILGRTTPLSSVCGRVCPAPCMEGCNRAEYDGSVNIRGLEKWIGDRSLVATANPKQSIADPKRFAIVGGGPAGLAAAWWLSGLGHAPTIYEGEPQLGGVLRTGIPEYRLPRKDLNREIQGILDRGVEAVCGEFLSAKQLNALATDFDAVILATGLQKLRSLGLPGEDAENVEQGIHFLHRLNSGGEIKLKGHVVVLGGGNTAMDCARSALRNGATQVTVAYRRTRAEMPAIREEIEEAIEEGVHILELRQPMGFSENGIQLAECDLGEPDESGRRRPIVSDRVSWLACETVLLALGQSADLSLLPNGWELNGEQVEIAGNGKAKVFAAGDIATWDGTVTHAIGSGRRTAGLALRALGFEADVFKRPDRNCAVPVTDIRLDHFAKSPVGDDRLESHRCFSCGHCTECDTCMVYCPEGIIRRQTEHGYEVDYEYCKGCGICVVECPRDAMVMQ